MLFIFYYLCEVIEDNLMVAHNYRNKITYLSFVMSILIIYRHAISLDIYSNMPLLLYGIESFVSHFTDIVVPTFFTLSGFLFFQNFSFSNIISKLKSRFFTIVIPFLIWSFIGFIFFYVAFNFVGDKMNSVMPKFEPITWFTDVFIHTKYNVTWFLRNLICYIYITPLIYFLIKHRVVGIVFLLLLFCVTYYIPHSLLLYLIPFALGGYCGIHHKQIVENKYDTKAIIVALSFLLISTLLETIYNVPQGTTMIMPLRLLQVVAVWILADVLAVNTPPQWWETISFFIYCIHSMILESIQKIFFILFHNTAMGAVIDFLFAPVLTFVLILLAAYICRKKPFVWKCLTGNRGSK